MIWECSTAMANHNCCCSDTFSKEVALQTKKHGCLNANICGPQTDRKPRWLMIWCRISDNDIFPHDHACWTPRAESNGLAWDWRGVWLKNWGPKEAQLPTELTNTQWYHFGIWGIRWLKRFQIDEKHICDACSLHLLSTTLRITFWDHSRQLPAGQIRSLPWTRDQCYHRQCRWHRQFPLGNPLHTPSPGVSGAAWGSTRQGAMAVPWLEGCQHEDSGWFGHSFVLTFWRNIKRHQLVDFVDSSIENYPVLGHIQMHADAIHLLCPFLL